MHDREEARRALGQVHIAAADPSWPLLFLREKERLRGFVGGIAEGLEHYGSTAVPGLSAKPVIDMMGPVACLEEADAAGERLAGAGYGKIDAGFHKRRFFRRLAEGGGVAYHLHLVVSPTWPVKNEILLRDWLIRRPDVARAYEALKLELAAAHGDDMPRYTDGKTAFLRAAVNDARVSLGIGAEENWDE